LAAGNGCSTSVTPACAQAARFVARSSGVDDELRPRRRASHRGDARGIARRSELDLEQRALGGRGGGLRHRLRRRERDRQGGGDGLGRREAEKLVHRPCGAFGRQIPERAVERVARRAARHGRLQAFAIKPASNVRGHRLDRGRHALDRLAVARIGHAFAPPAMAAVGQLGDHDDGFGLGAAADGERAGDRPALDADGEGEGTHRPRMIRYREVPYMNVPQTRSAPSPHWGRGWGEGGYRRY